jgi:hypothetical protein
MSRSPGLVQFIDGYACPTIERLGWNIKRHPIDGTWSVCPSTLFCTAKEKWYGPYVKIEHATAYIAVMLTVEFSEAYPGGQE